MMKSALKNHWYLFPGLVIFTLLYATLSFHNRLAADDFFYLGLTKEGGPWYAMIFQYKAFCGRWASHLPACSLLSYYKVPYTLFIFHLITLAFLLRGVYLILKRLFDKYEITSSNSEIFLFSFLFCIAFYFSCYSISETWFWYIAVWTYLWSIILGLFLANELYNENHNIKSYLIILICSGFIGGACESYAVINIILLVTHLIFDRVKWTKKNLKEQTLLDQKILFALVILLISFAITYFSPGTAIRKEALPQTSFLYKTFMHFKVYAKLLLILTPPKLSWLLIFSFPWYFIGKALPANFSFDMSFKKYFFRSTFILFLINFLILLPTSYAMSDLPPGRALSIVSLCFCVYFALFFIYIGNNYLLTDKTQAVLKFSYLVITSILLIIVLFHQSGLIYFYDKTYDARVDYLLKMEENGNKKEVELDPLPDSGMLYWEEVKADTTFYVNEQIKRGLNLHYPVKLKQAQQ